MNVARALGALLLAALGGCHRAPVLAQVSGDASASEAGATTLAARCKMARMGGVALGQGASEVVIGGAVTTPSGLAVGLLRSEGAHASSAIALVAEDLSAPVRVDLGPALGDASPPRAFVAGGQLFAAAYVRSAADAGGTTASRTLGLFRIDGARASATATARRVQSIEQALDESAAFDVASTSPAAALVAWDEDAQSGNHGVIEVARVSLEDGPRAEGADGGSSAAHVVSPDTSDADEPQLAARPGGYWVAWIAHRAQIVVGDAATAELEGPAEGREFRWIEVEPLDEAGKPVGPVRRVTSATGHISGFTPAPASPSAPAAQLDIYVRDEEEAEEGAGGRLLRITVRSDGADPPVVLVAGGAGRGAPDIVGPWLVYADTNEHARLLPLGEAGSSFATAETSLDDARPLGILPASSQLLAAFPGEHLGAEPGPLRAFACAR